MKKLVLLFLIFSHITFSMEATENAEAQEDACECNDTDCEDSLVSWACSVINDGAQKCHEALEIAQKHPVVVAYLATNLAFQLCVAAADCAACFQCKCYCNVGNPTPIGPASNMTDCYYTCTELAKSFAKCVLIPGTDANCTDCPSCNCYCNPGNPTPNGKAVNANDCMDRCYLMNKYYSKCT